MLPAGLEDVLPAIAEREAANPDTYPRETIRTLHDCGFIRSPLPADLGGTGCSLRDAVRATEALARHSGSAALITSMPLGLAGVIAATDAVAPPRHRVRWHEQRERLAAAYRACELYAACNSEKGAGGSLEATKTVARRANGRFFLTGEKILASSGRYATHFFSTAKAVPDELPGTGIVEFFLVPVGSPGVEVLDDWDGFGMHSTESQTVRYVDAPADDFLGFPDFINIVQPLQYWYCLFAAIPLGCVGAILQALGAPTPTSPALRVRLSEALMRYEALRAYLLETADAWHPGAEPALRLRVLRTKTYVTQEATKLAAELFALSGGR
ncbi:MAG: acyl-CoA/acyl-ACP dehydrogenase, partial [Dehalococcoidia bacterium]|nr:acyl-CoA/acyl-ACP dehydrogenase [Dehalococcoidia bacterium]